MGTGSDIAIDAAQITLVKGDLRGITAARGVSVATVRNMKQNLGFAFLYNALGIPIAAGVLYPATGLLLSPDDRRRRHEPVQRLGHRQRAATATRPRATPLGD